MHPQNIFQEIPTPLPEELVETLLKREKFRVQRIVSHGHASPPGFWYDQEESEWVILLSGAARLTLEGSPEPIQLGPGGCLNIPAHLRHRLEWTDPDQDTVWLAVFYK